MTGLEQKKWDKMTKQFEALTQDLAEYLSNYKFENETAPGVKIPIIDVDSDSWKAKRIHAFSLSEGFHGNLEACRNKGPKFENHPARLRAMAAIQQFEKESLRLFPPENSPLWDSKYLQKISDKMMALYGVVEKVTEASISDSNFFLCLFYNEIARHLKNAPLELILRMDHALSMMSTVTGSFILRYWVKGHDNDRVEKGKEGKKLQVEWKLKAEAIYKRLVAEGSKKATGKLNGAAEQLQKEFEKKYTEKRSLRSFENLIRNIRTKN
jgi:hypothetical protein